MLRELLYNNKGMKTLNLNECHLGEDGAIFIAQGLYKNTTLETLNLADNGIGDEGIDTFAQGMKSEGRVSGYGLKHLDISSNFITDKSGVNLAEALAYVPNMISLTMKCNTMTELSGAAFLETIKFHLKLGKVDLSKNLVPFKFIEEINHFCSLNSDKGDDKRIPKLKKEKKLLAVKAHKQGKNVNLLQKECENAAERKASDTEKANKIKSYFWEVWDTEHQKRQELDDILE